MSGLKSIKKQPSPVADSWEDDDSNTEVPLKPCHNPSTTARTALPLTPMDPAYHTQNQHQQQQQQQQQPWPSPPTTIDPERARPEKTDAVARRMIAAGLGLKAPKQTEEQKAYQKSVREQERKRRDQQRLDEQKRKEEVERAKAAMWDD